jgi:tetratricopeptide (TPR) repeat protein
LCEAALAESKFLSPPTNHPVLFLVLASCQFIKFLVCRHALSKRDVANGIDSLLEAITIFPNYFMALDRLGNEYFNGQEYKAAVMCFEQASKVNPKGANVFYMLGYSQYMLKQDDAAIKSLRRAVGINASSATQFLLLGITLRRAKQFTEAEKELKKANEVAQGKLADAHWHLALLYGNDLRRYGEAADELEKFLKAQPNSRDIEKIKDLIKKFREKASKGQ